VTPQVVVGMALHLLVQQVGGQQQELVLVLLEQQLRLHVVLFAPRELELLQHCLKEHWCVLERMEYSQEL
jgi:hypothetical protein